MWTHIIFINLNLPTKSSPLTPPPPYHYSLQGVTRVVVKVMMIVFHERYKFYVHSYRIAMIFIFQSIIKMIRAHGYVHIGMLHIKMECALVHIIFQNIYPSIHSSSHHRYRHHPSGITRSKINTHFHIHNIFIMYILLNAINKEILSCLMYSGHSYLCIYMRQQYL